MSEVHTINVGDTLTPIGWIYMQGGNPVELTGLTPKVIGKSDAGTAWIAETASNISPQPTVAFTVDTTRYELIANAHKAKDGYQVIVSNSGGALPTGLAAATRYFVRDVTPNRFKVALTPNGNAIPITGAGTGTHSFYIVGSAQYDFQTADVATAGIYWLWPRLYNGSERDTFPIIRELKDRGLKVEIVEAQ